VQLTQLVSKLLGRRGGMIWARPHWACGYYSATVAHLGLGWLVFKLGLGGSHLYIRRGDVSLEGKQEE
jgi:hypothetical protein